jgi:hypothetical protein
MPAEFILYVADPGPVKCAACEFAKGMVARQKLDCAVRPGSQLGADVCAHDKRLWHALAVYYFENDGHEHMPDGAPFLVYRLARRIELDAADFAEMAGEG